jgi:aminoglycoside phosphotransferase (APT) family kinase protein
VPVARPLALCEDPEPLVGTPFFRHGICQRSEFLGSPLLPDLEPKERQAIYDEMNGVLAKLHTVEPMAVGLSDFGRSGNYFARQIDRWTRQYRASQTCQIEAMEQLIEWLAGQDPGEDETRGRSW